MLAPGWALPLVARQAGDRLVGACPVGLCPAARLSLPALPAARSLGCCPGSRFREEGPPPVQPLPLQPPLLSLFQGEEEWIQRLRSSRRGGLSQLCIFF